MICGFVSFCPNINWPPRVPRHLAGAFSIKVLPRYVACPCPWLPLFTLNRLHRSDHHDLDDQDLDNPDSYGDQDQWDRHFAALGSCWWVTWPIPSAPHLADRTQPRFTLALYQGLLLNRFNNYATWYDLVLVQCSSTCTAASICL